MAENAIQVDIPTTAVIASLANAYAETLQPRATPAQDAAARRKAIRCIMKGAHCTRYLANNAYSRLVAAGLL